MLASSTARYSGVSGASWPSPQGLVWSNDGCPGSPRTMKRFQWPFKLGYFEKSTIWALAADAKRVASIIAPSTLRYHMAVLPNMAKRSIRPLGPRREQFLSDHMRTVGVLDP